MSENSEGNFTVEKGIAFEVKNVEPVPGHWLVVFEKVGKSGLLYFDTLEEKERLKVFWLWRFLRAKQFCAYAVSNDDDLRHELVRDVTTRDQGGSFKLRCILTFRISNPREVAQHLDADPLRRIEIKAADLFANTAARVDWVDIEDLGVALERHLLESTSLSGAGVEVSNLKALRTFAFRRGFEIQNVELTVQFSSEFGEVIRRQRKEARTQVILQSEAKTKQLEVELNSRLAQAKTVQESLQSVISSSGANLERIMTNISDGVTTPTALKSVVVEFVETMRQVSQLVEAPGSLETASSNSDLLVTTALFLPIRKESEALEGDSRQRFLFAKVLAPSEASRVLGVSSYRRELVDLIVGVRGVGLSVFRSANNELTEGFMEHTALSRVLLESTKLAFLELPVPMKRQWWRLQSEDVRGEVQNAILKEAMTTLSREKTLRLQQVAMAIGEKGTSHQEVLSLRKRSWLLGFPGEEGHLYPAFQIDLKRHEIYPEVRAVNETLGAVDDPLGVGSWWFSINDRLGTRPVNIVGTSRSKELIQAAKATTSPVG